MKQRLGLFLGTCAAAAMLVTGAGTARAQVTPAEGYTPPDDTPKVNVGRHDLRRLHVSGSSRRRRTRTETSIHPNSFNLSRAYINVTGSISHWVSFRITPDVVRVGTITGSDGKPASQPGLTGTLTYRLKYAYGQINFDDSPTFGRRREGLVAPIRHAADALSSTSRRASTGTASRARSSSDREGFLTSSDFGASAHLRVPRRTTATSTSASTTARATRQPEANDQKAFQARLTAPAGADGRRSLKGLRLTGFYDGDHYVRGRQDASGSSRR